MGERPWVRVACEAAVARPRAATWVARQPPLYSLLLYTHMAFCSPPIGSFISVSPQRLKDEIAEVTNEIENLGSTEER